MNTDISKKERTWKETPRNCSEGTRRDEHLFFEMSRVVESPEMLMSWVEWFRRLHIPCAVAQEGEGPTDIDKGEHRFFVWLDRQRPEAAGRNRARKPGRLMRRIWRRGMSRMGGKQTRRKDNT